MNDTNQQMRKLELHYVFQASDSSHALDAFIRNKCEDAFLKIAREVANSLGGYVSISVEPHAEGGLRDVYRFIISSKGGSLAAWCTLIVAITSITMQLPSGSDKKLSELSIVKTQLEIEKLQLEIARLKNDNSAQSDINNIQDNVKIRRQKSHFYSKATECQRIKKIEFSEIEPQTDRVIPQSTVSIDCQDFNKFIENNIEVPSETIENIIIEIISPVLVRSSIQWKGILKTNNSPKKKIIDFKMQDYTFQNDVLGQKITFRHGTHIECTLLLQKKVDTEGNIIVSRYDVITVTRIYDGVGTNIIMPPRKIKKAQFDKQQPMLFDLNPIEIK